MEDGHRAHALLNGAALCGVAPAFSKREEHVGRSLGGFHLAHALALPQPLQIKKWE